MLLQSNTTKIERFHTVWEDIKLIQLNANESVLTVEYWKTIM